MGPVSGGDDTPLRSDEPVAEALARHERLLGDARFAVDVSVVAEAAVSVGVAGGASAPTDRPGERPPRIDVRRRSGGTAILHLPGDLVWALVYPRLPGALPRGYTRAYEELSVGLTRELGRQGLPTVWSPAPGVSNVYCPLGSRGSVLTVGGRILGGAAQHVTRDALLVHGTLSRTIDRPRLGRLFPHEPAPVWDRLVGWEEVGGPRRSDAFARDIARALEAAHPSG